MQKLHQKSIKNDRFSINVHRFILIKNKRIYIGNPLLSENKQDIENMLCKKNSTNYKTKKRWRQLWKCNFNKLMTGWIHFFKYPNNNINKSFFGLFYFAKKDSIMAINTL